jgi:tetratricopeptide (TPR) repeat protein
MAVIVWLAVPVSVDAAQLPWTEVSRKAQMELEQGKFACAVTGYRTSIQMLEKSSPNNEAKYDLYLKLADAHTRSRNFAESEKVLGQVGPLISGRDWNDPLLVARYLNRKAELELAQGRTREYVSLGLQSLSILKRFIGSPEKEAKAIIKMMTGVAKYRDWDSCSDLAKMLLPLRIHDKLLVERRRDIIDDMCGLVRVRAIEAISQKEPDKAASLLSLLTDVDPDSTGLLNIWRLLIIEAESSARPLSCGDKVFDSVHKLIQRSTVPLTDRIQFCFCLGDLVKAQRELARAQYKKSSTILPANLPILQEVDARLLIAAEATRRKLHALAEEQYLKLCRLEIDRLKQLKPAELVGTLNKLFAEALLAQTKTDDRIVGKMLQSVCTLTESDALTLKGEFAKDWDALYFRSHLQLARLLCKSNQPRRAEEVLSMVCRLQPALVDIVEARLFLTQLQICSAYGRIGEIQDCKQRYTVLKTRTLKIVNYLNSHDSSVNNHQKERILAEAKVCEAFMQVEHND